MRGCSPFDFESLQLPDVPNVLHSLELHSLQFYLWKHRHHGGHYIGYMQPRIGKAVPEELQNYELHPYAGFSEPQRSLKVSMKIFTYDQRHGSRVNSAILGHSLL